MDTCQRTCRKCHISQSLDAFGQSSRHKDGKDTVCRTCQRKKMATYRAGHREELRLKSAAYFASHREQHRQTMKSYDAAHRQERCAYYNAHKEETNLRRRIAYATDPIKIRERNRRSWAKHREKRYAYRVEHKERDREQSQQYRKNHAEKLRHYQETHREQTRARGKAWTRNNPEKNAAREQRRRARKRMLPDTWTTKQLVFMLEYWQHACAICGNPKGLFWTLAHDHWIPLVSANCPGTVSTNMIPLCHGDGGCNNSKNDTEPHIWLRKRFGARKAEQIQKAITAYFAQVALLFSES